MQAGFLVSIGLLAFAVPLMPSAKEPQVTIHDTGSTNRLGVRVTFDREGHATVEARNHESRVIQLPEQLCNQFIQQLKALGPLQALPARHCMKSASFGSSLFVEFEGHRSPDLSCPGQESRIEALQKQANEILRAAEQRAGIQTHRTLPARLPAHPD